MWITLFNCVNKICVEFKVGLSFYDRVSWNLVQIEGLVVGVVLDDGVAALPVF
jgi:hypothetical protein